MVDPTSIRCDAAVETSVRESFARQAVMDSIGAVLEKVSAGEVTISLPFARGWTQQNGFLHAGILTTILDSACGYAAMSLRPAGTDVLTVEFKTNLLAPAVGERFEARARVRRSGRTLAVAAADAFAIGPGEERLVATMLATIMRMETP
ncbi:MAG: PaaI family thioesterase [Acidobacteriota bacterium]|nr:PaaI family thioesterase [Acidobacteriota bacterium]